jgi:RNA polymerase sigma-70 factor, ECF subfamily
MRRITQEGVEVDGGGGGGGGRPLIGCGRLVEPLRLVPPRAPERPPEPSEDAPGVLMVRPSESELARCVLASLPRLERLARRLTASQADAADLVQATCLRALEKWQGFVSGSLSDFKGWVVTIMWHLHYDNLRKRRRERLTAELDDLPSPSGEEAPPLWQVVEDRSVAEAVSALPPALKGPYVLFAVDQLTYAAIADRLQVPLRTVGTRIFRARARLRAALQKQAAA